MTLSDYTQGGGLMAAQAPSTLATGSVRGEKCPRSTASPAVARGECYALRDYGVCHLGANGIFDRSAPRKHRSNGDRGGGGGRVGVNSSSNGGGGRTPGGGQADDGRPNPGGGASIPGSSVCVGGGSWRKAVLRPRRHWGADRRGGSVGHRWNQQQRLGKARADLSTDILASSTSNVQVHARLGARTSLVASLGVRFAG